MRRLGRRRGEGTTPPTTYALTVTKAGTGNGTVTSSPSGITCGSTCSASYTTGTSVTLTAAAATGSTFTGWSGACTGTGSCVVSMTAAKSVTATFALSTPTTYALTVTKNGAGTGTVTVQPGRYHLRQHLQRELYQRDQRHPDRHPCHRLDLHRVGRGMRGDGTVHTYHEPGAGRDCNLHDGQRAQLPLQRLPDHGDPGQPGGQ